jgi:hypothetical protein
VLRYQRQGPHGAHPPAPARDRFANAFAPERRTQRGEPGTNAWHQPPAYSEGGMPQPHRVRERAPPYQSPLRTEGDMRSARAPAAAASSASSSAAPRRYRGSLDHLTRAAWRRPDCVRLRDPYQQGGKPKEQYVTEVVRSI